MVYIISGTNRTAAKSPFIAAVYKKAFNDHGEEAEIIDLRELPKDFVFSALYENAGTNTRFNDYRKMMTSGDKFVFIVPEYNGSFPGVLKAFIDGLEYPGAFRGKKCALIGISSGDQGGVHALSHLTDIFNYCGMHVMAKKVRLSHIDKNFEEGELTNEAYVKRIAEQAAELIAF